MILPEIFKEKGFSKSFEEFAEKYLAESEQTNRRKI